VKTARRNGDDMHGDIAAEEKSPHGRHSTKRPLNQRIGIAGDSGCDFAQAGEDQLTQDDAGRDGNKQNHQRQNEGAVRQEPLKLFLHCEHEFLRYYERKYLNKISRWNGKNPAL